VGNLGGRVASTTPPSPSLLAAQGGNSGSKSAQRWWRGSYARRLSGGVAAGYADGGARERQTCA
jgi:hypothetical protein